MAFAVTHLPALDGNGAPIPGGVDFVDISGTGVGPWIICKALLDPSGVNVQLVNSSGQALVLGGTKKVLYAPGTNGFTTSPFNIIGSTDISGLANGSTVLGASQGSGANGKFSQTDFGNAAYGYVWFTAAGAFTPTAGGNITGWFLQSTDGGTTYEKTVSGTALPRAPDFIIPLYVAAYANGDVSFSPRIRLPEVNCKIFVQNNSGVALSANNHLITCGPVAVQY